MTDGQSDLGDYGGDPRPDPPEMVKADPIQTAGKKTPAGYVGPVLNRDADDGDAVGFYNYREVIHRNTGSFTLSGDVLWADFGKGAGLDAFAVTHIFQVFETGTVYEFDASLWLDTDDVQRLDHDIDPADPPDHPKGDPQFFQPTDRAKFEWRNHADGILVDPDTDDEPPDVKRGSDV